ncbi:MAG: hypothetical protein FWH01_04865 [Oscillospiraceae bacterium]|nr:hypothetical protein [Oscillospiraceae bacterium]
MRKIVLASHFSNPRKFFVSRQYRVSATIVITISKCTFKNMGDESALTLKNFTTSEMSVSTCHRQEYFETRNSAGDTKLFIK